MGLAGYFGLVKKSDNPDIFLLQRIRKLGTILGGSLGMRLIEFWRADTEQEIGAMGQCLGKRRGQCPRKPKSFSQSWAMVVVTTRLGCVLRPLMM